MARKIFGSILIIIGGLPLVLKGVRMLSGDPTASPEHAQRAAGHLGSLSGAMGELRILFIVVPIVLVVVGIILFTHKEKAVKK